MSIAMSQYFFYLHLTKQEILPYYQGQAQTIVVTTTQGLTVQFPAMHIRQFVTNSGIDGYFRLETKQNKFFSLTKLA